MAGVGPPHVFWVKALSLLASDTKSEKEIMVQVSPFRAQACCDAVLPNITEVATKVSSPSGAALTAHPFAIHTTQKCTGRRGPATRTAALVLPNKERTDLAA